MENAVETTIKKLLTFTEKKENFDEKIKEKLFHFFSIHKNMTRERQTQQKRKIRLIFLFYFH